MPLDGTYQAHTSTHASQTQAGLPSACTCWAEPCHHLSSLTAPVPSSAFASPPTQGTCQMEETSQGETLPVQQGPPSTPGQWMCRCPAKQDSSKALTASRAEVGFSPHLPEIQVEMGISALSSPKSESRVSPSLTAQWGGGVGKGLVAKKTF